MIGETVMRRPGGRQGWLIWLLVGVLLAACSLVMSDYHLLLLSLPPFAIAAARLLTLPAPFTMHFGTDGIEVLSPRLEFIPYRQIEALCHHPGDRRDDNFSFPFVIAHAGGVLEVPAGLNVSSSLVFRFLADQLPDDESLSPPPSLRAYFENFSREFGVERVQSYRALPDPRVSRRWFGTIAFALMFVVGIVWVAAGSETKEHGAWAGIGGLTLVVRLFGTLICLNMGNSRKAPLSDGGIVISPVGFALQKGKLLGQMRWDELTKIEYLRAGNFVRLHFVGGQIVLNDVYDRPLRDIYNRLMDYWEGPLDGK